MKHSQTVLDILKFLIVSVCILLIIIGLTVIVQNKNSEVLKTFPKTIFDTTISVKKAKTDTVNKLQQTVTIENTTKTSSVNPVGSDVLIARTQALLKEGYDLIFLGIILLFVFYALPYLSEFSFLQLFSAKFREQQDAQKALANDVTNTINSTPPVFNPDDVIEKAPDADKQKMTKNLVQEKSNTKPFQSYADDPQKGKWGQSAIRNRRKLSATVSPLATNDQLFKIVLKVISTDVDDPLRGDVIFHLHPTFVKQDPKIYVLQGMATLELVAWGAFTVGAEADGGNTQLELDLSDLPDAPMLFRTR